MFRGKDNKDILIENMEELKYESEELYRWWTRHGWLRATGRQVTVLVNIAIVTSCSNLGYMSTLFSISSSLLWDFIWCEYASVEPVFEVLFMHMKA